VTFTKKTDIWAFGCSFFEAIGRAKPWNDFFENQREKDTIKTIDESRKEFYHKLIREIYPSMAANKGPSVREIFKNSNTGEFPELAEIMYKCLEIDVEKRLTIEQVIEELKKLLKEPERDLGIPVANLNKSLSLSKSSDEEDGGYAPSVSTSTNEAYLDNDAPKEIKIE